MIDLVQGPDRFVAFVGAAASAMPPSSLPTWKGFNNLLLECLCERLADYSRQRQPTNEILSRFRATRDESGFFAPDFQAQLMEEEIGADYFRVWQSLETDVHGPVHSALAELAARGRLAAIVTTNFDRLIEGALRSRGQAFEVFYDPPGFERLEKGGTPSVLPVIKIHGSIEDASSLVDTLRQRVIGRPASLMSGIRSLLIHHPWLYLGFSGNDFGYNRHYLGILDAAAEAKGFVFLVREGSKVADGVRLLEEAYGADKASIVRGDLSTWLPATFGLPAPPALPAEEANRDEAERGIRQRIERWVEGLGPMAVVNITVSMLKTLGMDADALWLLRKTWKSYRTPDDTRDKSYARYNYNYGVSLLDAGFIRNPVPLNEDKSNYFEWKEHADQNAYEFLARSYRDGGLPSAGAHLAAVLAYRGEVGKALSLATSIRNEAAARANRLDFLDVILATIPIYDILRLFDPAAAHIRAGLQIAQDLGDEPRRAMLCAYLGRFLSYGGHFDEADGFIKEAESVGTRLGLRNVILASQAARGRWLSDSGKSDEAAVQLLQEVVDYYHYLDNEPLFTKVDLLQPDAPPKVTRGHHPILCRILLDLNRAATFAGNTDVVNQTLDELDELATEVFPGYCPHYYLAHAECSFAFGSDAQKERIPELIARAREMGRLTENPWAAPAADDLESRIKKSVGG